MKRILFLCVLILSNFITNAQYSFDMSRDNESGQMLYVGQCTFDDIEEESSFDWFKNGSNAYQPDPETIAALKKELTSCQLIIFMGTWCEDTHLLLPKLYKTMLLTHCFTNYKMYGVDREKKSKNNEEQNYNVQNVPTIIVLKNGKELGRIVEHCKSSIEGDLFRIVNSNTTEPSSTEEKG